ncbi:MAG TPA: hypothetical protein VIW02_05015, partial [Gammaproteobacteria bacterium]
MALALPLHLLLAVVWVGGMFFAYQVLRPVAAAQLDPPQRLPLTGYTLLFGVYGGFAGAGWHVHLMQATGWLMIALFLVLHFG